MADSNQKSTFSISDSELIFKLHDAALNKAEAKLKTGGKNVALVNTGIGKQKKADKTFQNKDGLYEVGVVVLVDSFVNPESKDMQAKDGEAEKKNQEEIEKKNKEAVEKAQQACIDGLNEYFTWFSGKDSIKTPIDIKTATPFNLVDQSDVKKLVTDYKDFIIPSLDEKKLQQIKKEKKDLKPIVGYKVAFELEYKGK